MNENVKTKWYGTTWFLLILLILLPYIGIPFMWVFKKDFTQQKKIIFTVIFGLYTLFIISAFSRKDNQLESLESISDVNTVYSEKMEDIMDKKPLQNIEDVTDSILKEKAIFATELVMNDTDNHSMIEKVDTIEKLVTLDDLAYHIDEDLMKNTAIDIFTMWEADEIIQADEKTKFQLLYITKLLDKYLSKTINYVDVRQVNFDIYQILKDTLRDIDTSVESNTIQANKRLSSAKSQLGIKTPESIRQEWIDDQFNGWNGTHIELEDLIIDSLNDEKSYDHIDTTYIDVDTQQTQYTVNKALSDAGFVSRVEIDDLLITTIFSAKNAYGGTIKCTAMGIASYADQKTTLIGIE